MTRANANAMLCFQFLNELVTLFNSYFRSFTEAGFTGTAHGPHRLKPPRLGCFIPYHQKLIVSTNVIGRRSKYANVIGRLLKYAKLDERVGWK